MSTQRRDRRLAWLLLAVAAALVAGGTGAPPVLDFQQRRPGSFGRKL